MTSLELDLPRPSVRPDWRLVSTIMRRELRDSLRDWRIVVPVLLLTSGFPFIMNFAAGISFSFVERYGASIIAERLIPFGMLVVGFFPITFSLVIALETFVGERERNSLEALFATPASDIDLYLGKLLAALLLPLAAAFVGISVYVGGLWLTRGWLPEGVVLVQVLLLTLAEGLVMVSGAVVVSSHTTSVRAANLLASFIIVPMALLLQLEAVMMFWGVYEALWFVALALLVVDVIMIRAGLRTFNRESILSRELDHINLRWLLDLAVAFFRLAPDEHRAALAGAWQPQRPFSLRRIYTHDLPWLLRRHRGALLATLVVGLVGLGVGARYASVWPLPELVTSLSTIEGDAFREQLAQGAPGLNVLPEFSSVAVVVQNIRALLLATGLSVISFGTVSLMVFLFPMGLVGYLLGQFLLAGQNPVPFLAAFILPHGIVEIPATLIATAFALRLGAVLIAPPAGFSAGEAFLQALADFVKVFVFLVVPLLVLAALLEVYLTPLAISILYG